MKAFVLDPRAIAGMRLGYNRPLEGSELDEARKHIRGVGNPVVPGEFRGRFANLTGVPGAMAVAVDTFSFTSDQKHPLGALAYTNDGRWFRYAHIGGVDSAAGKVYQSAAPIANHLALTSAAQAIGDGTLVPIVVTPGATAGAANLYTEGHLTVEEGPGAGLNLGIGGHPAITASVAFNLRLDADDVLPIAFTTSTKYGLHHNRFQNVILAPTTVTADVCGVSPIAQTAAYYGWLQTRGPAAVLINGTPGVGIGVVVSATTTGAVDVAAVAAEINVRIIGRMMQVGVSTKYNTVNLLID